eukprot:FR742714.1.p1 GENE.FR742714.1~~FR742714.1.p1  ORF type:complete len:128 (+),score=11.54 FR742714.1:278-661(+)
MGPLERGTRCEHGEPEAELSGTGSGHTHSRIHSFSCEKYDANGFEVSVEACGAEAEDDERYDLLCTSPTDYLFTVEDPEDPTESEYSMPKDGTDYPELCWSGAMSVRASTAVLVCCLLGNLFWRWGL